MGRGTTSTSDRSLNGRVSFLRHRARDKHLREIIEHKLTADYHGHWIEAGDRLMDLDLYGAEDHDPWLKAKSFQLSTDEQPKLTLIAVTEDGDQEKTYIAEENEHLGTFEFRKVISRDAISRTSGPYLS